MSALIRQAFADWRECRAEYDHVLYSQYETAAEACREALLNRAGRRARIDPLSLFMGPRARAFKYASDELLEHWAAHPRVTFAEFERQWIATREAELRG